MRAATLCTSALLACALAVSGPAAAKPRAKHKRPATELRTIRVDAAYTEGPGQVDGVGCRLGTPDCKVRYVGWATFTGTFAGEAYYDLLGWGQADGKLRYEGPDYVTGRIEGCGSGTFILDEPYGEVDMTRFDPVTQSAPGYNTWEVRRGSGTGGLKGLISGSGVNNWTTYPLEQDSAAKRFGKGRFTGTVTCRVPRRRG